MKETIEARRCTWKGVELENYGTELKKEKEERNGQGWVSEMSNGTGKSWH